MKALREYKTGPQGPGYIRVIQWHRPLLPVSYSVFFIELTDFIHEQFFQETSIFFGGTIRGSNNAKNPAADDKAVLIVL